MSVRDDLLNDKEIVLNETEGEAPEHTQMCSYYQDELEDICSYWQDDTCGDDCFTTKQIYVEIVDFTTFVKFWTFDVNPDLSREKRLIDKIQVSAGVYLDVGCTKQIIDENE